TCSLLLYRDASQQALHSFPTRRSSDLLKRIWINSILEMKGKKQGGGRKRIPLIQNWIQIEFSSKQHPHFLPGSRNHCPNTLDTRSEEHTSELQSRENLVCRLLLEKKKK